SPLPPGHGRARHRRLRPAARQSDGSANRSTCPLHGEGRPASVPAASTLRVPCPCGIGGPVFITHARPQDLARACTGRPTGLTCFGFGSHRSTISRSTGEAMKIEQYVPITTPRKRISANSRIVPPPKTKSALFVFGGGTIREF